MCVTPVDTFPPAAPKTLQSVATVEPQDTTVDAALRIRINAGLVSLLVGSGLLVAKYFAYEMTGSTAVLSDALESIVNVVAAIFALGSLFFAGRPADRNHPYGHGKIEFFSAVFEGGMIAGVVETVTKKRARARDVVVDTEQAEKHGRDDAGAVLSGGVGQIRRSLRSIVPRPIPGAPAPGNRTPLFPPGRCDRPGAAAPGGGGPAQGCHGRPGEAPRGPGAGRDGRQEARAGAREGRGRPPRRYGNGKVLTFQARGYAPELFETAGDAGLPREIVLKRGRPVRGRVVDEAGKPVAGVRVAVELWRKHDDRLYLDASTDRDGRFCLNDAPLDGARYNIHKTGYMYVERFTMLPSLKPESAEPDYVVTLKPPLRVVGSIVDAETNKPLPQCLVVYGWDPTDGRATCWPRGITKLISQRVDLSAAG